MLFRSLLCAALTVYFRDLAHILGIVTMAWQYLTPVMYDIGMVPANIMPVFNINPMTPIIVAYRDVLYYKQIPQLSTLLHAIILGAIVLVSGVVVFRRLQRGFAEEM